LAFSSETSEDVFVKIFLFKSTLLRCAFLFMQSQHGFNLAGFPKSLGGILLFLVTTLKESYICKLVLPALPYKATFGRYETTISRVDAEGPSLVLFYAISSQRKAKPYFCKNDLSLHLREDTPM
jgi:hypothetical protein